jgi:ATP-dependent Clp protease ATP-binding subunit ClpA
VFERFTDSARRVLVVAQEEARQLNHGFIGTEHILLGLIGERDGVAAQVLSDLGIFLDDARRAVEAKVGRSSTAPAGSPPFTPRAKKLLELSLQEAIRLRHYKIGPEHLLLGLVGEDAGVEVLGDLGVEPQRVRELGLKKVKPGTEVVARGVSLGQVVRGTPRRRARHQPPYGRLFRFPFIASPWSPGKRLTGQARRVMALAEEEALQLNHSFLGTEHILLGLIREGEGVAARALTDLGITLDAARTKVEELIGLFGTPSTGSPPLTPRAQRVLELSFREVVHLDHNSISTEHILLGITRDGKSVATQVLTGLEVDLARVRAKVLQILSEDAGEK